MKKLFFALAFFSLCLTDSWAFAQGKEELLTGLNRKYHFCHVYGKNRTKTFNVTCDGDIVWEPDSNSEDPRRWSQQWTELLGIMKERSGMVFRGCRITLPTGSLRERHYCDFVKL